MTARRCDGYELFAVPELRGVTFCRKEGARRVGDLINELRAKIARLEAAPPVQVIERPSRSSKGKRRCKNCQHLTDFSKHSPRSAGGECTVCGAEG